MNTRVNPEERFEFDLSKKGYVEWFKLARAHYVTAEYLMHVYTSNKNKRGKKCKIFMNFDYCKHYMFIYYLYCLVIECLIKSVYSKRNPVEENVDRNLKTHDISKLANLIKYKYFKNYYEPIKQILLSYGRYNYGDKDDLDLKISVDILEKIIKSIVAKYYGKSALRFLREFANERTLYSYLGSNCRILDIAEKYKKISPRSVTKQGRMHQ